MNALSWLFAKDCVVRNVNKPVAAAAACMAAAVAAADSADCGWAITP